MIGEPRKWGHSSFPIGKAIADIKWGHSSFFDEKEECPHFRQAGFSYVEVMVAIALLAIALLPAIDALKVAMLASGQHATTAVQHYRAYGRMEELMTENFGALDAEALAVGSSTVPTSYSDASGTPNRRLVFLSPYDADNADGDDEPFLTGTDPGIVWLRVQIEGSGLALESLKSL
jgi:prepilin-type N-terminal cleavage/methylation domain-containing protein